jgi:hypothetical protein
MTTPEQAGWEIIGGIYVESGTCAFAAASGLPRDLEMRDIPIPPSPSDTQDLVPIGIPLVACVTKADLPLSVDVRRDDHGEVIAARMVFVDDFDDLDGIWRPVERLDVGDGKCVACDPWIGGREPWYWFEFDIKPGAYDVAVFDWLEDGQVADCLGFQLRPRPTVVS